MSDTPRTDAACGWPWGHHGRIECGDLRWSPDGPFVHSEVARAIERENAALRAELEAQAVVNGKGGEREAKLLAEAATLQGCVKRVGAANDKLFMENLYLGKDKQRLDFLESTTGSGWALLHLDEGKQLTRKQIDRRMATEPKP